MRAAPPHTVQASGQAPCSYPGLPTQAAPTRGSPHGTTTAPAGAAPMAARPPRQWPRAWCTVAWRGGTWPPAVEAQGGRTLAGSLRYVQSRSWPLSGRPLWLALHGAAECGHHLPWEIMQQQGEVEGLMGRRRVKGTEKPGWLCSGSGSRPTVHPSTRPVGPRNSVLLRLAATERRSAPSPRRHSGAAGSPVRCASTPRSHPHPAAAGSGSGTD